MKKIIHLSDTHVEDGLHAQRMENIVDSIILTQQPAADYVVVMTGDLMEDAGDIHHVNNARRLIDRLRDAGFIVLAVPGNHDYGDGIWGSKKHIQPFKRYFFGDTALEYPKLDMIDEIAFIGLDSMAEELNWYDRLAAEGELGLAQLIRLQTLLAQDRVQSAKYRVVYLHHHPFFPTSFHQLKDTAMLGEILENANISALLFGHNHDGRKWNGLWNIPRVYDGGSATSKNGAPCPQRVIDLDKDPAFDFDAEWLTRTSPWVRIVG